MSESKTFYDRDGVTLYQGDCREALRGLPPESVQCVVTSPPYWGLRDYSVEGQFGMEGSLDEYVARLVETFREVRRALRPDGVLWLNIGDSYAGSWGAQGRQGKTGELAGRSACAVRQIAAAAKRTSGTGARQPGLKAKDLVGVPWSVAFALRADGWWLRSDVIWEKPNPMPESVEDRPTRAHEYLFLMSKSRKYFYDADAIKEPLKHPDDSTADDLARAFSRRRETRPNASQGPAKLSGEHPSTRNRRSVWRIAPEPFRGAHFATFPTALVEPCILAGSRPGDLVLDPFNGAGTTGLVAARLGRRYVGVDLSAAYLDMSIERIERATRQRQLFAGAR